MHALDNRSRTILKEIIRVHVDTGKPVSSRALFKSSRFDLSPASIRNIMADLTDAGFLAQPHTSAGRIPTDRAYRLYIDELMRQRKVADEVREQVDDDLASAGSDVTRLFQAASRLLSRLSGEVGFVIAPDALHTVVRSVRFLSVAPGKILAVQVNEPDVVVSRVIETRVEYSTEELEAVSQRITREFCGRNLHVLGSEDALTSDPRLSAVLTSYGTGETLTGMLGVIGPARREYPRVIPVVELLGRALSDRLEPREGRDREDSSE
ncbi:MAG: hypothetical protein LC780_11645 [Acidobacteria bacterium]|nr:hypothetical protein [Acidobacteriota bacterium]